MKHTLTTITSFAWVAATSAIAQTTANPPIPNISLGTLPFAPTVSTQVTLPPNGRLEYTTIDIPSGVIVTFVRNVANTPVYLLASGDINIRGIIDVNGDIGTNLRGGFPGPGGFAGGAPGSPGIQPGDGLGPGGGAGGVLPTTPGGTTPGNGSFGTVGNTQGAASQRPYGSSLLIPLVGGSGGGGSPTLGGGGGGGAILIASSTRIHHEGTIRAQGGGPSIPVQPPPAPPILPLSIGTGSGGAVRLLAPMISGNGSIHVHGWNSGAAYGHGRISCEMLDRSAFALSLAPAGTHIDTSRFLPFITPPNPPSLRIVSVGGIAIPSDAPANYTVTLPINSRADQPIVIEASGFGVIVDAEVRVAPVNGSSLPLIPGQIDNSTVNPATQVFRANLPANTPLSISAWTR